VKNILNFNYEELKSEIENMGWEKFRADQICDWVYHKKVFDFAKMTNLSKVCREKLRDIYYIQPLRILEKRVSKKDKTTKYLFELEDGNTVESVLLFHRNRITACISTQVGCPLKCAFCATGQGGFVRNLETSEIISQILTMEKDENVKISNIVYMGMGEPLLNYDKVIKSVKMVVDPKMLGLSQRHVTISTAGIVPKIYDLTQEGLNIYLSVSLHAPNNRKRDRLMPINYKYPLEELVQAIKYYLEKTNRRVTIEYILIKGFNDFKEDALELAELLKGLKVNVNLIPYNPIDIPGLERSSKKNIKEFESILKLKGIEAVVREEKGNDIDAACGQLRTRRLVKNQR